MKTINYICYDERTGYGNASFGLIHALQDEGIQVKRTLIKPGNVESGGILIVDEADTHVDAVIIHTVPEYYPYWLKIRMKSHPNVPIWGYTAWETDKIPSHWAALLNEMCGIFVPSTWNKEVLKSCGVTVPIEVLPHISEFHGKKPDVPPSHLLANALKKTEGTYTFYCISMWNERKNLPILIHAFLEEFREEENVSLLLKTDRQDWTTYRSKWRKVLLGSFFQSTKKSFRKIASNYSNHSKIIHISDELPASDLAWLHYSGDCFISCTHGEGWGMGSYEAAWYGNSVAITEYGGQLDYLSSENSFLIPFTLGSVVTAYGKSSYTNDQNWADVDLNQVRKTMRHVFENQKLAKEKGQVLSKRVSKFSNKIITNTCIEVLLND